MAELSSNGVHEGTFRYELGNSDLSAETNFEVDAGFELDLKHVTLSINPFFNWISNYVYLEKLASLNGGDSLSISDGTAYQTFKYTQGKARLWGSELSIDVHPHPYDWLHFKNTFAFVLASQLNSENKYLPFIPSPKFQSELRADLPSKGEKLQNAFIETDFEYFFKQDRILAENNFETPTPAYTLLNSSAGFDWTDGKGKKYLTFIFIVQNIFDKTYQNHLSRLKYAPENPASGRVGIFNMGRNFVLKLIVPIDGKIKS